MLRRNFLRQALLAAGAVTATALGCCPPENCSAGYEVTVRNVGSRKQVAEVVASKEKLHRLVLAFQTNLWPSWQTDSTSFGRKTQKHMQLIADDINKSGKILCDVSCPVLVDAFLASFPPNAKRDGLLAFSFCPGTRLSPGGYFNAFPQA